MAVQPQPELLHMGRPGALTLNAIAPPLPPESSSATFPHRIARTARAVSRTIVPAHSYEAAAARAVVPRRSLLCLARSSQGPLPVPPLPVQDDADPANGCVEFFAGSHLLGGCTSTRHCDTATLPLSLPSCSAIVLLHRLPLWKVSNQEHPGLKDERPSALCDRQATRAAADGRQVHGRLAWHDHRVWSSAIPSAFTAFSRVKTVFSLPFSGFYCLSPHFNCYFHGAEGQRWSSCRRPARSCIARSALASRRW